jgi:O-antigen/teichoic acid export membrane protein
MSLSVGIGVVQGVAVTYVMSRYLGLVAFGQLGLIISCTNVMLFASGSVVANVLRESARGRLEGPGLVAAAMLTQALLAAPIMLASLGVLWLVSAEPALLGPAAILGAALLVRTALGPLVGLHLGRERMEWQLLDSAQSVLSFAALLGLVVANAGLYALPLASLIGAGGVVMATAAALGRRMGPAALWPERSLVKVLALSTLLWAAVNVAQQVHWAVEPLLASALMDVTRVGVFIAGGRLQPGIRSLAAALGLVVLPAFVRAVARGDSRQLSRDTEGQLRYLVPGGLVLTVVLFALADPIVTILYPRGFEAAALILRRLSLDVTPMLLHWQAMCLLFAGDRSRALLAGYGVTLAVRLALGACLGSAFGATGLATAQVLSDWALAFTLHAIALRTLRLGYAGTLLRSTLPAGAALIILAIAGRSSVPLATGAALAVYGLGWFASLADASARRRGAPAAGVR